MKSKSLTLAVLSLAFAFAPLSASARIHKVCDLQECCFVDSGGNGYCVDRSLLT